MGRGSQAVQAAALALGVHSINAKLPASEQIDDALGLLVEVQKTDEYKEICRRRLADEITAKQFFLEVGQLMRKLNRGQR